MTRTIRPARGSDGRVPAAAALTGSGLGLILLLAAAVVLVSNDLHSIKALVAVWLWALPVLGTCAGLGWLAGVGLQRGMGQLHLASGGPLPGSESRPVSPAPSRPHGLGARLEQTLDATESMAATLPFGPALLGVGMGLAVVIGGLGVFLAVWALLVGVLP